MNQMPVGEYKLGKYLQIKILSLIYFILFIYFFCYTIIFFLTLKILFKNVTKSVNQTRSMHLEFCAYTTRHIFSYFQDYLCAFNNVPFFGTHTVIILDIG